MGMCAGPAPKPVRRLVDVMGVVDPRTFGCTVCEYCGSDWEEPYVKCTRCGAPRPAMAKGARAIELPKPQKPDVLLR
jgi:hypothetical protein